MSAWTTKTSSGEGFEKAPVGNHPAVLVGLVDLGHQWKEAFGGQAKPGERQSKAGWKRTVHLTWELLGVKMSGTADRDHTIGCQLTWSLHKEAALTKFIVARLGRALPPGDGYDISQELGKPVLLSVVAKGEWPRVDAVAAVPAFMLATFPKPQYPLTAISLEDFKAGKEIPDWIPFSFGRHLSEVINECREIRGDRTSAGAPMVLGQATGQEIPF